MGGGLALALRAAGRSVDVLVRTPRPALPGVGLFVGEHTWPAPIANAAALLIATQDSSVSSVATRLAGLGGISPSHAVLHLSGLLDRNALLPLEWTGATLGSLHPLQTIADPAEAPALLAGAYAVIEGDVGARAAASDLASAVGMRPVEVDAGAKPAYHAGATMISNYAVTLADLARRAAERAGIPADLATRLYLPLLRGTVDNLVHHGAHAALTGAIRRGDAATVAAHLDALEGDDRRAYVALGFTTLRLAREAGLQNEAAEAVETVLRR